MGQKEDFLKRICVSKYGEKQHPKPTLNALFPEQIKEINRLYKELGGKLPETPFRFKSFDVSLKDFIIELDEQEHFNRYRLKTLASSIYKDFVNFDIDNYLKFCRMYESRCRIYGKFGKTSSSDKQFGPADSKIIPDDPNWSRWKQRALYDMIKDAYSVAKKIPIIRISIYDNFNGRLIKELLDNQDRVNLLSYIDQRLEKVLAS